MIYKTQLLPKSIEEKITIELKLLFDNLSIILWNKICASIAQI